MISRGRPLPYPITENVDKRIGDSYPVIEKLVAELPKLVYLADNLHAISPFLEIRGNNTTKLVEWRIGIEGIAPSEGWKPLFTFDDISNELSSKIDLIQQQYLITKRQADRLERELDKVKRFISMPVEVYP